MRRSHERSHRIRAPRHLLRATVSAVALTPSVLFAADYSFINTSGTWGNSANWNSAAGSGVPGSTDNINQSLAATALMTQITLDSGGDSIKNITLNTTSTSSTMTFLSPSSSGVTLTIGGTVMQAGTNSGIVFGNGTNPLTISTGVSGTYVPFEFNASGTGGTPNITIANTNSIGTLTFNNSNGSSFRVGNAVSNSNDTVTIQGNVSLANGSDMQLRQIGTTAGSTSTSNITVNGNLTGTLTSGGTVAIDAISGISTGGLAAGGNSVFTLAGSATGLTVGVNAFLEFGAAANGVGSQYKNATLLLANANAVNTTGQTIPIQIGSNNTVGSSVNASLNLLSNVAGANYSNAISVVGFTDPTETEQYTIGGTNASGTTTTFSGSITTFKSLQLESQNAGATAAFTNSIVTGTSGFAAAVTVVGSGTTILSGSNTYSGGTTVNSTATLMVNNTTGSGTGSGSVSVAGDLSGSGTISGAVSTTATTGTIQPGTSSTIGTLHTGALTLFDGSTFAATINSNSVVGNTGASSQLISSGAVTLGTSSFALLSVTDLGSTTLPVGDVFTIIQSSSPITTTFHNLAQGASVTAGSNVFSISYTGDDVTLTTVAPEPGSLALLAIGAMAMLRRRKKNPADGSQIGA